MLTGNGRPRVRRNFFGSGADNRAEADARALKSKGFVEVEVVSLLPKCWSVTATAPPGVADDAVEDVANQATDGGLWGSWRRLF